MMSSLVVVVLVEKMMVTTMTNVMIKLMMMTMMIKTMKKMIMTLQKPGLNQTEVFGLCRGRKLPAD